MYLLWSDNECPFMIRLMFIYQGDSECPVSNRTDQHFAPRSQLSGCRVSKAPQTVSQITHCVWHA